MQIFMVHIYNRFLNVTLCYQRPQYPLDIHLNVTIVVVFVMIRLILRRVLLLSAWSAVLLLLARSLIRNSDDVTIPNKLDNARVMDKQDQGRQKVG